MVQIGTEVKDSITGFSGTVTAYCLYLTGCNQALVQPSVNKRRRRPRCPVARRGASR